MKHLRIDFLLNVFVMLGKETPLYVVFLPSFTCEKKKIYTPSLSVVRDMLDCLVD